MTASTYASICDNTQSTIHGIISSDANIVAQGTKVIDGIPHDLLKGRGTDIVSVHTPVIYEELMTRTKYKIIVVTKIEIFAFKEEVCRDLTDFVRASLFNNLNTTRAARLFRYKCRRSDLATSDMPTQTGKAAFYTMSLYAEYEYRGD